jgi:hypothetical protein
MSGNSGPSVPNEPSFKGYTQPANWVSPTVSGQNLMVKTSTLRSTASMLNELAHTLQYQLSEWQSVVASAASGAGSWAAAKAFAHVMNNAYTGVQQFTSDLQKAHSDMATRLGISADRYESNEADLAALANRSVAGSTVVGAGGNNTPVDPTPAQARVLDLEHHMEAPGDNENWQATLPVTEDVAFSQGSTSGYSWQQVKALLDATNPSAITNAGTAYTNLASTLKTAADRLAGQGGQLSNDWGGPTAVTAISQVQQLWQTAADLQANTYAAGATMQWYGPVLAAYKASPPTAATPSVTKGAHESAAKYQAAVTAANTAANNAADQQAQQHLAQLNSHMQTAFYNMPGAVNKNLPPPLTTTGGNTPAPATTGGSGGLSGGGMTGGANGGASGGSAGPSPSFGSAPGGTTPPVGTPPSVGTPPGAGTLPGGGTSPVGPLPVGSTPPGYHLSGGTTPVTLTGPTGPSGPGPVSTLPPPGGGGSPGPVSVLPPPGGGTGPGSGDPLPGGGGPVPAGGEPGPGGLSLGEPGPGGLGSVGPVGSPEPELPGVGTPGIGPDGVITGPGGVPGAPADDLAASGGGALGGEAGGQSMMPMTGMPGGGTGQGGLGRMRESWSSEDEGTWGPDTIAGGAADSAGATAGGAADSAGATADGMFPGMMPLGGTSGGQGQDRDRRRQAWMDEEEDVWGAGQPAVPPVISPN